ncbi:uncharacterized protein [Watersipora subatra]|uniref:uncharacterized protein n=1 Tax=Watersipora subatra TaxID=2589382 RepID=UPI00355B5E43
MSSNRSHLPFKDSIERREFEKILFTRRCSKEYTDKTDKSYGSVSRHADITISHEIKKLLDAQAKINSRIQDIKHEQQIARWSSLPRIDEKVEVPCVDPYPITFQTEPAISLPGGGKMYPLRPRRKSLEFEDLSLLTYKTRPDGSPMPSPGLLRKAVPTTSNQKSSANHSPSSKRTTKNLSSNSQSKGTEDGQETGILTHPTNVSKQKTSPATPRARKSQNTTKAPSEIAPAPSSPRLPIKKMNNCSPLLSRQYGNRLSAQDFNHTEKDIILRSPLSKRKLNSIAAGKQNLLQLPDEFL